MGDSKNVFSSPLRPLKFDDFAQNMVIYACAKHSLFLVEISLQKEMICQRSVI